MQLDSQVFDTGALYTPPNDVITVPRAGTYLLIAHIGWNNDADGVRALNIQVNGANTEVVQHEAVEEGSQITRLEVSGLARLQTNDVVSLVARHTAGNDLDTNLTAVLGSADLAVQWLGP